MGFEGRGVDIVVGGGRGMLDDVDVGCFGCDRWRRIVEFIS